MSDTDQENGWDTLLAFHVSALNGIACLAAALRGNGILTDQMVDDLHAQMSEPLNRSGLANNEYAQGMQGQLDRIFAAVNFAPQMLKAKTGGDAGPSSI